MLNSLACQSAAQSGQTRRAQIPSANSPKRPITVTQGINDSCLLTQRGSYCLSRRHFESVARSMPKLQLHDHLEGSVRPTTILEEADRLGVERPARNLQEMKDKVSMRPGENLLDFLKKFNPFRFIFDDKQALERIAYEAVEDNHKDGVKYVELRMNCQKNEDKLSIGEVMDAVLDGMHRGSKEFGVEARFIASINRSYPPEDAMKIVKAAVARIDRGVVGLDLAGDEINHPPAKFKEAFSYARQNGLQITVHAGEAVGPSSIEEAIDELGAERIGHGTRLREDERVLDRVRDEHVHLEMCPHSNHLLNVVPTLTGYPIREYYDYGISTSLNTDDKHIFDVSLIDEYSAMAFHNGFTLQELQDMNLQALEHAFIPMFDKQKLVGNFESDYKSVNQEVTFHFGENWAG